MTTIERLTSAYLQVLIDVVGVANFNQRDLARLNTLEDWAMELEDRAHNTDLAKQRSANTVRPAPPPAPVPAEALELATRPEVQELTGVDPVPGLDGAADVSDEMPQAGEELPTAPPPEDKLPPGAPDYSKL